MVVELLLQPGLQAVEALVGFDPHLLDQVIEHVNSTVLFHVYHPAIVYNKKQTDHPSVWHQKAPRSGRGSVVGNKNRALRPYREAGYSPACDIPPQFAKLSMVITFKFSSRRDNHENTGVPRLPAAPCLPCVCVRVSWIPPRKWRRGLRRRTPLPG